MSLQDEIPEEVFLEFVFIWNGFKFYNEEDQAKILEKFNSISDQYDVSAQAMTLMIEMLENEGRQNRLSEL